MWYLNQSMDPQQAFHQRFKRVLLGIGVLGLLLILFFSVRYADHQRQTMRDTILADSLLAKRWFVTMDATDSLQLHSFVGKRVVVAFWASWSPRSMELLDSLSHWRTKGDSIVIVAATVKDNGAQARAFMRRFTDQIVFVDGTLHYLDLRIVGVPSAIAFDARLKPEMIATGDDQMRKLFTTWLSVDP